MSRKRKKTADFPQEVRLRHERTQRKLAERIVYHEARIAARERDEGSEHEVATADEVERLLHLDARARHDRTQRLLAERIAYHRAKLAEERALRDREAS